MVPLLGESRLLAGYGLKKMSRSELPGIKALIEVARLDGKDLGATNIAFGLAPRINAAGRIGHAYQALDLLRPGGTLMLIGIPEVDRVSFSIDQLRRTNVADHQNRQHRQP